jgi:acetyl-CoA acetyltransferase
MSNNVYVQGTGMIKFGRYDSRNIEDLAAEAIFAALDDCGLAIQDMQELYCGCCFQSNANPGQRILKYIGQTGIACTNVANACATGATAFRAGWMAIKAGVCDVVLVVGVEKMGAGMIDAVGKPKTIYTEGIMGSASMPAVFAEAGSVHMAKYGTTFEQFAKVSVKNHHHSVKNPLARYQMETPLEEVMKAEMIAYPNTKLMCSVNVDGAAAAVLVSEKKAKQLGMKRSAKVLASVLVSDPYEERDLVMWDFSTLTRNAAKQAYEQAGVDPKDLSLVELHDCFATAELLHYENLGLCADGDAGKLIDDGSTWAGGRIPVNLSGGLLSKGHPIGATGVANIYEIVQHLRGEAGARQCEGASIGLTHVLGLGSACAIHLLEKCSG